MELERAFLPYAARALNEADIPAILNLYSGNPEYFLHCPPSPSRETVKNDMLGILMVSKGRQGIGQHFPREGAVRFLADALTDLKVFPRI